MWLSRTLNFHRHCCLPISVLITGEKQANAPQREPEQDLLSTALPAEKPLSFQQEGTLEGQCVPSPSLAPNALHAEEEVWRGQRDVSLRILGDKDKNQSLFKSQHMLSEYFLRARLISRAFILSPWLIIRSSSSKAQDGCSSDLRV